MIINIKIDLDLSKIDLDRINQIGLDNSAQEMISFAQANAPYDTGKLKQNIGMEPWRVSLWQKSIRVWPRGIIYAQRREFENYKNPHKKFYMRKTGDVGEKIVEKEFKQAVKIIIDSL